VSRCDNVNTPSHLIINVLVLEETSGNSSVSAIALGAVLPDIPIWVFYVYARVFRRLSGESLWKHAYHDPRWHGFFDAAHSFPLILLGAGIAAAFDSSWWFWLFLSMGLHALCDLPLHHDDAHRHFFPLSNWRFASPVSYWDARYHGAIASRLEVFAVLMGCIILWQRQSSPVMHWLIASIAGMYVLFSVIVWILGIRRGVRHNRSKS